MMKSPNRLPPFDWVSFLLLNLIALMGAWTLAATKWDENLSITALIALLGVWAGTALARSRFSPVVAGIFATAYGFFVVGWQIGTTLDPALVIRRKIIIISGRFAVFISMLIAGESNEDPLMFVLIMGLLFWFISTFSAWSVMRKGGVWGAILPGGITIFTVSYFYLGSVRIGYFLAIYILLLLLLAIRVDLSNRQKDWESVRARVPLDTTYRVSIAGLMATVLLVVLSWGVPAFARSESLSEAWKRISNPFEEARDRVGDAFGTVRGPAAVYMSDYDDVLELKAGTQPLNHLVMDVDPIQFPSHGGRFYWRTRVYETYQDRQWTSPEGITTPFDPNDGDLSLGDLASREIVEVSIALKGGDIKMLFLPSQPIWVERTSTLTVTPLADGVYDLLTAKSQRYIRKGEAYLSRGSIAVPGADQLRAAGEFYPDWVLSRYLQLPDTITDRTTDLALAITQDLDNPFDKALAITRWLRSNIEYNRETEQPPEDAEAIDWFLFDYKIGFCNYYASAEIIMLRSLGIPARMAAGYARGTFDRELGVYHVYAEDSHAWPEVYFPGIGWVEFEPTTSQPPITRPEALDEEGSGGPLSNQDFDPLLDREDRLEDILDPDTDPGDAAAGSGGWPLWRGIALTIGGLFIAALLWLRLSPTAWVATRAMLSRGITRVGMTPPEALIPVDYSWDTLTGRIYANWTEWLKRLGMITGRSQTAMERVAIFSSLLPDSAEPAQTIVGAYTRERFGQLSIDEDAVKGAWRSLRGGLWLALLWKSTDRWRRKP